METLNNIWEAIKPYFSGVTVGAIISCILLPLVKGMITKATEKFNIEELLNKQNSAIDGAVEKSVDRIKDITFKQSIQPLVESELKKVGEAANAQVENSVAELRTGNAKILCVLKALSAYFDDSIISDEKKEAVAVAIKDAESALNTTVETTAVIEEEKTAAPAVEEKKAKASLGLVR